MAKTSRVATLLPADEREVAAHRRRIVAVLLKICRSLERLQVQGAARRACRDVTQWLTAMLTENASRDPEPR